MGSLTGQSLASEQSLTAGLELHLLCNHYPPVPRYMVTVCIQAIQCFNDYGHDSINDTIELPDGVSWKGRNTVPVHAVIQNFHLDPWLNDIE